MPERRCTRITRKELLAASALNALMLKEAGIGFGDRVVFLLPHCIEQMVWVQAAKRVGAICTCLPESISVSSLAGRLFDTAASLCVTSNAKSSIEGGSSHKALVLHAIMDYVSMEAVLRTIKRVLPEQRWRTSQGKVDSKGVCEAIEASFKGDGAVSPKAVAAKLEVIFSMQPPLREKAELLATHLQEEMVREHASRLKTRVLVVPDPHSAKRSGSPSAEASAAPPSAAPAAAPAPAALTSSPGQQSIRRAGSGSRLQDLTTQQLGSLVLSQEELSAKALPALLSAAGKLDSYSALLALDDEAMVAAIWRVCPPVAVASMHPKGIIYTSGSSGNKATGLVQDTGGYASGVRPSASRGRPRCPSHDGPTWSSRWRRGRGRGRWARN